MRKRRWPHAASALLGEFGPWGRKRRFFEPGEVRLAILSLLEDGAKHGYELMNELQSRSGGIYRASAGAVYPTLQSLLAQELIARRSERGRKVYSLTEAGKRKLEEDREAVRRIWRRARSWQEWGELSGPGTAEIVGPLREVVRAALRASCQGRNLGAARKALERAQAELERLSRR